MQNPNGVPRLVIVWSALMAILFAAGLYHALRPDSPPAHRPGPRPASTAADAGLPDSDHWQSEERPEPMPPLSPNQGRDILFNNNQL
ncbi:hypothetical protein [uncultured Thiodictyon sp.]|uniref:hypothetical protein n=1 Tax=uncultured Thiodictyon sp. TaxID=1846217 RepID=UPI0025EFDE67|nr:hypothetical protein [uncultured Thiodictyon sp.]